MVKLGWMNSKSISSKLIDKINLKIGDVSEEIVGAETIVFYKMMDKKLMKSSKKIDIKIVKRKHN